MKLFESYLHLRCRPIAKFVWATLLCLAFLEMGVQVAVGQVFSGPGGISPFNTEVWLHADGGTFTSPNWTNSSPMAGPYSIVCNSVNELPSLFNFNPGLRLDNNNDEINITPLPPANDFEMFIVFNTTEVGSFQSHFRNEPNLISAERGNFLNDYAVTIVGGRLVWYKFDGPPDNQPVIHAPVANACNDGFAQLACISRMNSGNATMFMNGTSVGSGTGLGGTLDAQNKIELFGGAENNNGEMQGEIAEFIYISNTLGALQRQKVHSYLALKYGITQTGNYVNPNGVTIYDPTGGFANEVVGIIREDGIIGNPFHQRQSRPSKVVNGFSMYSGSGYGSGFPTTNLSSNGNDIPVNGQSLVIGHNNAAPSFSRAFNNIPGGRLSRFFKAFNTNGMGMVTLNFDNNVYTQLSAGAEYSLVISQDTVFNINDAFYPMVENNFDAGSYRAELDFPDMPTGVPVYFTVVKGRKYGPGGVAVEMAAWYRADSAVYFASGNVSQWRDASGRGKHLTNSTTGTTLVSGGLNFNHYIDLPTLDRQFGTASGAPGNILGRTVFFVGNLAGSSGNANDNLLGFNNNVGIRTNSGTTIKNPTGNGQPELQASGASSGVLRSNGGLQPPGTHPTFNASWSIISAVRAASNNSNQRFWIGGYDGNNSNTNPNYFNISEAVIYTSDVSDPASFRKIESYFAIKYGITLDPSVTDYRNSNDAVVYTTSGYPTNVTVIGRDDASRLNQKQSRSINTTATITLGLNGFIHPDSNDAHPGPFLADRTFVAVGDNGQGDCWTTLELTMSPNPRQWLRVPREWKITKTGTVDSVAIRITDAPGSFRVPQLPANATGYVLLLSSNSDFSLAPVPTVIPLVDNGTYLEAVLTNAQMSAGGGTNYFTIGVQLPLAEYQTQVPCVGDTITLVGSNILNGGGLCIELQRPGDTITLTQNTSISPTNFVALASNSTVGCLDTARWVIPPTVVGGYQLAVSATCNNIFYPGLINDSIRLGLPLVPDISVGLSDTVYLCLGDPNINLDRNSNPGGGLMSITNYPGAASVTLNGLLDSASLQLASVGTVYVHAGNLGHHLVTYRYPSGCSSTDSVHIYIGANSASTYSYANSALCITDTSGNAATTLPDYVATGGAFSSIPAGLNLNPATGEIFANTSNQGTYLATFTPEDSTCGLPVTIPITINIPQQTIFDYPLNPCAGTPSILPTISTYAPGGTFSISPTAGVSIHPVTGNLTITNAAAGPYIISYTLPGSCVANSVDSIFVLIKPTVVFPPLGTAGQVCKLTPFVDANAIPVGGTYFSSQPSSNLVINGNRIWVDSSAVGGPYVISYVYADANGCLDTASQFLTILPLDNPVISFPRDGYCTNEPPQTPFFFPPTSTAGSFSSSPAGLTLATNGTLTPSTSLGGTYTINFAYNNPACPTPIPVDVVQIAPAIEAGFTMNPTACFGSGSITLTPDPGAVLDSLHLFFAGNPYPTSVQHVQGSNTILFVGTGGDSLPADLSYSVVNTVTNSIGCTEQSSAHFLLVGDQNSTFDYLEDLYCANTSDPTPFIYGVGGGVFSSPTLVPQTELDTATGLLNLLSAFTGNNASDTFFISYTTPGPCPSTSWDTVYVREGYDSYFQFPLSIVCSSIGTVVPTDVAEDSVGVSGFIQTAGPTINLNPQTGVITNLQNLNVGPGQTTSITVAHWTGSANNCLDTTTQVMQISMLDTLFGIEYVPNVVCGNQLVLPILSGDTATSYVNNPIGVTYAINGFGVVDARFSQPGIHNIVMTDRDVCGERDTAVLEILGLPDASFIYDAPGVCTTDSFFIPDSIKTLGGTFSYSGVDSFFVLNLDDTTGVITIQGSDPGLYTVYHSVVSSNGCPNTDSVFVTLSRSPVLRLLEASPGPSVCINQPVTFSSSGDGTVSWFVDNVFTGRTGPIYVNSSLTNGQVVKAVLRNTSGCTDSLSIQMEILPPPTVTVVDRPSVITENDPFTIQLQPGQDNTIIAWRALAIGLEIRDTLDTTVVVNANDVHSITNVLRLISDYDPGTIQYWFTPMNNGCIGAEDSILIVVNPNGDRVFIPEVMTPNGDVANEVWEIRYDSDLSPTDYTIEVYNRSGGLVYTLRDLDERWDGGTNPDGVYWWILRHKSGEAELAGGLTIRRQ